MSSIANRRSVMTLYSDPSCPYCHRCRIVLAEKGVSVDIIDVENGGNYNKDLLDINPSHSLPTLVDRELVLFESRIIMEYLDERFPHPPLLPVYPVARARARSMMHRIDEDWYKYMNIILDRSASESEHIRARRELTDSIKRASPVFSDSSYFLSDEFSLLDCYLAALFWRLPLLGITMSEFGKEAGDYVQRIFERGAFQASLSSVERTLGE